MTVCTQRTAGAQKTAGAQRIVVVGNGMAGFRFVQELLALDAGFEVTVVGDEPGGAYNRAQLPLVLAGAAREDSIELADEGWYKAHGARLVTGTARRIDRARQVLEVADGAALPYDVLVLAAGSAPVLPRADGLTGPGGRLLPGAVAFRTLADCAEIRALAVSARHVVVLGGGVLGLETARGLAADGRPVTLVQRGPRLMERQLDAASARVLAATVRGVGVAVRAGASVRAVRGAGRVTGIVLDDGAALSADLLVLCCGTRPRAELARRAGLAVGAGVVVDDQMRSVTDPRVFAIGDCAEHRGRTHGLIAAAWAQAGVAASTVAGLGAAGPGLGAAGPGLGTAGCGLGAAGPGLGTVDVGTADQGAAELRADSIVSYASSPEVVRLKAAGVELAVLGSAKGGRGTEVIRFTDPARGVYQKLVVRDGKLAGAILLGDTRMAGTLTQLLDRGAALPADRSSLLIARRDAATAATDSPVMIPGHATICQCNGVTKAAICAAWHDGARNAEQVAARTRASTGCGTCRDAVEGIVSWLAAAEPGLVPA